MTDCLCLQAGQNPRVIKLLRICLSEVQNPPSAGAVCMRFLRYRGNVAARVIPCSAATSASPATLLNCTHSRTQCSLFPNLATAFVARHWMNEN